MISLVLYFAFMFQIPIKNILIIAVNENKSRSIINSIALRCYSCLSLVINISSLHIYNLIHKCHVGQKGV